MRGESAKHPPSLPTHSLNPRPVRLPDAWNELVVKHVTVWAVAQVVAQARDFLPTHTSTRTHTETHTPRRVTPLCDWQCSREARQPHTALDRLRTYHSIDLPFSNFQLGLQTCKALNHGAR